MISYFKALRDLVGRYVTTFQVLAGLRQLSGVKYIRKFGSDPSTSTTQREILDFFTGDTKVYNGWYDVNTQLYLISSNAGDTTQTVTITGIKEVNGDWVDTVEEFPLTGTTAVDIGSWLRILRLRPKAPHDKLLGEIYVTTLTSVPTDSDDMAAAMLYKNGSTDNKNTTKMTIFTTPSDKCALLDKIFISSISNKIGLFSTEIRPRGGDWISTSDFTQETSEQLEANYEYIPPETDIRLLSSYDTGAGQTAGSFHLYIVDKDKYNG